MQNKESQEIVKRFFKAIYELKGKKVIRGKLTFTRKYEINNRHFWAWERNHASDIVQLSWLMYLIRDYDVSAEWLMTGKGEMFTIEPTARLRHTYIKRQTKNEH